MNSNWRFRFSRARNLVAVLLKSRMAVAGIMIIIIYISLAVGAPLVTPYNPETSLVSGALAPPAWYSYFGEGSALSQNVVLESRAGFYSDPLTQGWVINAPVGSPLKAAYDQNMNSLGSGGSVSITLDRSSSPSAGSYSGSFEKKLRWPFSGAPYSFLGRVAVLTPTASPTQPVQVTVYIRNVGTNTMYNLTDTTVGQSRDSNLSWGRYPITNASSTTWKIASIGSGDPATLIVLNHPSLGAARQLFSAPGDYAYGVTVTLTNDPSSQLAPKVFLDELNIQLFGTSWGLLGTDYQGRDILTQLVYGARISLLVGLSSAIVGIVVGLIVGLAAGYLGKFVDEVLMRFTDMLLVLPTLPLIIILVAVTGGRSTIPILILVIGLLGWMGFARVVRAQVLTLKERPFVEAAKAAGAGTGHITTRHIIPNIVGLIYVNLALAVPGAILAESALSFLGLGDPSVTTWGRMLNEVQENSGQTAWWWILPPGLSIALVSLAFVLIGFALDSIFNPRLRQRR